MSTTPSPKVYPWEIEHQLDEARKSYADRMSKLLEQYAGKRSIHAYMIRDVVELAAGRVVEVEAFHEAQRAALVDAHAAQVAKLEDRVEVYKTRTTQLERMLSEKRTIREVREAAREDGETDVTISNGYHGWTVAGLEEISYRLRCGGAVDDTPVQVAGSTATASVPAPNLVTLEHRPTPPAVRPPSLPDPVVPDPGLRIDWRLAVALLVVVLSVVAGVVVFG